MFKEKIIIEILLRIERKLDLVLKYEKSNKMQSLSKTKRREDK